MANRGKLFNRAKDQKRRVYILFDSVKIVIQRGRRDSRKLSRSFKNSRRRRRIKAIIRSREIEGGKGGDESRYHGRRLTVFSIRRVITAGGSILIVAFTPPFLRNVAFRALCARSAKRINISPRLATVRPCALTSRFREISLSETLRASPRLKSRRSNFLIKEKRREEGFVPLPLSRG